MYRKRFRCSLAVLFVAFLSGPSFAQEKFVRGDVNVNGAVGMGDAMTTLQWLFDGTTPLPCDDAADVNDNGRVGLGDILCLVAYRFLGGPSPAAPFPECGEDPSADALTCASFDLCPSGPEWVELTPAGPLPPPRGFHSPTLVYDAATDRAILFGGRVETPNTNDVWILTSANGTGGEPEWIELMPPNAPGAPTPRSGHTAVYVPSSNRMVIFGGCAGGCLPTVGDTFVLTNANGLGGPSEWIPLQTAGPAPAGRTAPTAVYDPGTNRMVVFGGQNGSGHGGATFQEVWVLENADGTGGSANWILLSTAGPFPPGQYAPSSVYDPVENAMLVFAGSSHGTGLETNAVYRLDNANGLGGTPTWTLVAEEGAPGAPVPGAWYAVAYDTELDRMIAHPGRREDHRDGFWILESAMGGSASWVEVIPDGLRPPIRTCPGSAWDDQHDRLILFGGNGETELLNDTWVLAL